MISNNKILVVLSKNAGDGLDMSSDISNLLNKYNLKASIKKFNSPPEIFYWLSKDPSKYSVVAVNGGDGSVIAAIKALADTTTKLLVLPGGTANIIARENNLSINPLDVLEQYLKGLLIEKRFDIATVGDKLLATDMHSGWWSEAILNTPRELKRRVGMLAYGIKAIEKMPKAEKYRFKISIDGKIISKKSYTLYIANHGYQNFLGVPLFGRKHKYGVIQIAFINSLSPVKLTSWWLGKVLLGRPFGSAIKTYSGSNIQILESPKTYLFDDQESTFKNDIKVVGAESEIVIFSNPPKPSRYPFYKLIFKLKTAYSRYHERLRNKLTGLPDYSYSKIAPKLFVGGQYKLSAYELFKRWGIKAVVNMRQVEDIKVPPDFEVLQLKTKDWTPPSLEDFKKGVDFIDHRIKQGHGVYIHCRLGEGRGPSMAAAFLIKNGMTTEEALSHIKSHRPMVNVNKKQLKQLLLWQKECSKL